MALWQKSAAEIAEGIRAGAFTAREVTEDALARLSAVNPTINAVVQEMPDEARCVVDGAA